MHSGLSDENKQDLERIQKSALKVILKDSYKSYEHALNVLEMETLDDRREILCLEFAKKCLKNEKMKKYFQENKKVHPMITRFEEEYEIDSANTERLKNSPIIYMQRLLNNKWVLVCSSYNPVYTIASVTSEFLCLLWIGNHYINVYEC